MGTLINSCSSSNCCALLEEQKGGEVKIEKEKNVDGNRQASNGANRNNLRPAQPNANRPGSIAKSGGRAQSRSSLQSYAENQTKAGQTPNHHLDDESRYDPRGLM